MSEVFFSTDLCRHHTFCGGVSRVDRAMAEKTRSRSPARFPDEIAKTEASSVPPEVSGPKGADEDEKLSEGKTGGLPKPDELPEASLTETIQEAPEESTGRLIVDTMLAAARTLETCAGKLEASAAILENIQTDGQALQSLVAGVNYYASTTKASQASQSAQHKAVSWDWLSSPSDKTPLKETVKSIAHQSQNTSKAAFKMIEVSGNILEELKSHKAVMAEQCTILKLIASNQVEVSKMLKAVLGEEKSEVPPSGGSAVGGAPSGSTPPAFPHGFPPPASTFGNTAPTAFMGHLKLQVLFKPNSGDSSQSWRRPMSQTNHEMPLRRHIHSRMCHQRIQHVSKCSTAMLARQGLSAQRGVTPKPSLLH